MTLTKFLRTGAAALGALAVASAANAADIYTSGMKEAPIYVPPPVWTGFYIGGHIGAAWENFSTKNSEYDDYYIIDPYGYAPGQFNEKNNNQADAFGGVQFGYNFQSPGAFVYGLEVDLGGMSLNDHIRAHTNTSYQDSSGNWWPGTSALMDGESSGGFYGDVTGRLGWTWGPTMLYVKGGFAWLNANMNMNENIYDPAGGWGCANPGW